MLILNIQQALRSDSVMYKDKVLADCAKVLDPVNRLVAHRLQEDTVAILRQPVDSLPQQESNDDDNDSQQTCSRD